MSPEESALEQAQESGIAVVVDELTTETEIITALPNGSFEKEISTEPVRIETTDGWVDISTALVSSGTGDDRRIVPEAIPLDISLGVGGTDHLVTIQDEEGHAITESWPFGDLPAPSINGDTVVYENVLPDVDLFQIVRAQGVSQVLKVHNEAAARDPRLVKMRLFLDASGVEVSDDGDGGLVAVSERTGQPVFNTGQGQWWDSSHPDASAADPGGPGASYPFELGAVVDDGQLEETFETASIFTQEGITYPLYIDPEWSKSRNNYLYVDSQYPTTSYWNGQYTNQVMQAGYLQAAWNNGVAKTARSFWDFDTRAMRGKQIIAARFNVTETWAPSCNPRPVRAFVTGGINTGTTWNNQPNIAYTLGTQNVAKGWSADCPQGTVGFDLAAAKNPIAQVDYYTVSLRADSETDPLGWKRFANTATLIVTYNTAPATPQVTAMTGCGSTCTGAVNSGTYTRYSRPSFNATATDPDGGNLGIEWLLRRNGSATVINSSGAANHQFGTGGSTAWLVPSNLADGGYNLQVTSVDAYGRGPSSTFNFTIDTTPPPPPTVTPVTPSLADDGADPDGIVGQTAYTYSLSNPGRDAVRGYIYQVQGSGITSAPPGIMSCGQRANSFVMVCPASGQAVNVQVAAVTLNNTKLNVWSVDEAGNVGVIKNSGSPTSRSFNVGKVGAMPSIVDELTMYNTSWTQVPSFRGPLQSCTTPITGSEDGFPAATFAVPSGGGYAVTNTAVDTARSYTMSAWVCFTGTTVEGTVMSQRNDYGSSGGAIQMMDGKFAFRAEPASTGPSDVVMSATQAQPGQWYFVNAVYDSINGQMRITTSTANVTETWVIASAASQHAPANPDNSFYLGTANPRGQMFPFVGQIIRPTATQAVLSDEQFNFIWDQNPSELEGILK